MARVRYCIAGRFGGRNGGPLGCGGIVGRFQSRAWRFRGGAGLLVFWSSGLLVFWSSGWEEGRRVERTVCGGRVGEIWARPHYDAATAASPHARLDVAKEIECAQGSAPFPISPNASRAPSARCTGARSRRATTTRSWTRTSPSIWARREAP